MRATHRRRLALIACLLWVVGFEGLPAVHLALHADAAPHVHDADGGVIRVSFGESTHRHADGTVHRNHRTREPGARDPIEHGDGSLAHHGVAAIPAPPPLHQPLPVDRRPIAMTASAAATPISASTPTAAARGPPPSSFSVS